MPLLRVSVSSNVDQVVRGLDAVQREQVPFALALALTHTAQHVKQAEIREMKDVFDRPTPYTLNSLFVKPATKAELSAYTWLKDDRAGSGTQPGDFLLPEIRGGQRVPKRFERALQAAGVMPPGWVAVPGAAAKIDQYGNMSRGQIVQILSYFRTFGLAGFSANITDERKRKLARGTRKRQGFAYFVGRPGRGPLGIWQRVHFAHGSAVKPIVIFVNGANYRARFDFWYVAKRTTERVFAPEFKVALAYALATAKQ